jgi:phosphatidylglycerol:prolipoprotein diacylglycerol transferase
LWNFIGFGLIFWISRRFQQYLRNGDIILMYLFWYPFGRFFIEFLRTDSWFFPGTPFNMVHVLSFLTFTSAAVLLYLRHRHDRAPTAGRPTKQETEKGRSDTQMRKQRSRS